MHLSETQSGVYVCDITISVIIIFTYIHCIMYILCTSMYTVCGGEGGRENEMFISHVLVILEFVLPC